MRDDRMRMVHRLARTAPPTFGSADTDLFIKAHKEFAEIALDGLMRNRDHNYKLAKPTPFPQTGTLQGCDACADSYEDVVAAGFVTKDMKSLVMPCGSACIRIILDLGESYSNLGDHEPISDDTQIELVVDCLSQSGLVAPIRFPTDFKEIKTKLRENLNFLVDQIITQYMHSSAGLDIPRF